MKIAILADIHGNWPAMQAVVSHIDRWVPDVVVMAGDVVNRGPRSRECLQLLQERQSSDGWLVVRGNHEEYVLDQARPDAPRSGPQFDNGRNAYWTLQQIGGRVEALSAMPLQVSLQAPSATEVRVVHGSMLGLRDGIYPWTTDEELRLKISPPPTVLCVGHTHRPLIRQIDGTLVVNVGSVGLPFDGDHRASYGQLSWSRGQWQAKIERVRYDTARAEQDFFDTGFLEGAGELAQIMLVELRQAQAHIHRWAQRYEAPVLEGSISLSDSVARYLSSLDGGGDRIFP